MSIKQSMVYKPSGKLGSSLFVVPLIGIPVGGFLAYLYSYITIYSPFIGYLTLLFLGVYIIGLIVTISLAGNLGKSRNWTAQILMGLCISLLSYYFSWVVFDLAIQQRAGILSGETLTSLFLNPQAVWDIAREINETGWYSFQDYTPTGVVLWIFWGIEAISVLLGSAIGSTMNVTEDVFCERCNEWCEEEPPVHFYIPENDINLESLSNGSIEPLEDLEVTEETEPSQLIVNIQKCKKCNDLATWRWEKKLITVDNEGEEETSSEYLTKLILIGSSQLIQIQDFRDQQSVLEEELEEEFEEDFEEEES